MRRLKQQIEHPNKEKGGGKRESAPVIPTGELTAIGGMTREGTWSSEADRPRNPKKFVGRRKTQKEKPAEGLTSGRITAHHSKAW